VLLALWGGYLCLLVHGLSGSFWFGITLSSVLWLCKIMELVRFVGCCPEFGELWAIFEKG
jgi:hypothetical protein